MSVVEETDIIGGAKRAPARPKRGDKTRGNLQRKVTIKQPGARGPKPSSRKSQIGVRLEPNVLEAFIAVEDEIFAADRSMERNDVVRLLVDAYRNQTGAAPVAPDIPDSDRLAGRVEPTPGFIQPDTTKALRDAAAKNNKTPGEVIELIIQRSAQRNALVRENEALRAELEQLRKP